MPARLPGPQAQCAAWLLACVLVGFAPPGVTAFSLPSAGAPHGRRVAEERCAASCDETPDDLCDQQDANGDYTLGCDQHPTTSCDDLSKCESPPAPPSPPPWTHGGTYPHTPPTPPPPSPPAHVIWWGIAPAIVVLVVLVLFVGCWCCVRDGPGSRAGMYCWNYCPCCISCLHPEPVTRVRAVRLETGTETTQAVQTVLFTDNSVQLSDASVSAIKASSAPLVALPLATALSGPLKQ